MSSYKFGNYVFSGPRGCNYTKEQVRNHNLITMKGSLRLWELAIEKQGIDPTLFESFMDDDRKRIDALLKG